VAFFTLFTRQVLPSLWRYDMQGIYLLPLEWLLLLVGS
jgi:hypothetical protein